MGGVSLTSRTVAERPESSAPARRAGRATWRDPRLAVGLALVCLSVLVGVRVMAGADDTVPVLAAAAPLAAGQRLTADDLVTVRLRFSSSADADRYLAGDAELDDGSVLLRAVGAGELVPRAAISTEAEVALVELPLALDPGRVPAAVRAGSTVDVWGSAPPARADALAGADQLLSGVPVLAASRPGGTGPGGLRQVVVGVPVADEARLARVISRLADQSLIVVRRPG
jgi:Flp pilus assembly protein CpaB